jgi:excinuclease ABC subunit B
MGKADQVVEQIIRPTGLVIRKCGDRNRAGDNLVANQSGGEGEARPGRSKRMAEDLSSTEELGKVTPIPKSKRWSGRILRDLRLGVFDVLVSINLLRER